MPALQSTQGNGVISAERLGSHFISVYQPPGLRMNEFHS